MKRVKINHGIYSCNLDIVNYATLITLKNDIHNNLHLEKEQIIEGFQDRDEEILTFENFLKMAEDGMEYDLIVKISESKKSSNG